MKDFAIISDSCCDLSKEMREEYNIDYVMMFNNCEGVEKPVDLDWQSFTPDEFYGNLKNGKIYKTSQVSLEQYLEAFEKYAKEGKDILSISCSSALSSSVNISMIARDEIIRRYPDIKVICIDALIASLGLGMICMEASKMRANGKTIDEVAFWVEENKLYFNQVGTVDDLVYLKRSGRISGMSATMGNLLGLKPLIVSDAKGQNVSVSKVKGRKKSLIACVDYIKQNILEPEKHIIGITHANCYEETKELAEYIKSELGCKDVIINYINACMGATTGPDTICIYYWGKKMTQVLA